MRLKQTPARIAIAAALPGVVPNAALVWSRPNFRRVAGMALCLQFLIAVVSSAETSRAGALGWLVNAALALSVALDVWGRLAALLLAAGLIYTTHTHTPLHTFALATAALVAPWLALLQDAERDEDSKIAARCFLVLLGLLYLNIPAWSVLLPALEVSPWLRIGGLLVAASLCFERGSAMRVLGGAVQLALHVALAFQVGLPLTQLLLASTCLLLQRVELGSSNAKHASGSPVSARDVLALTSLVLVMTFATAQALGMRVVTARSAELLLDLGQTPSLFALRRSASRPAPVQDSAREGN